MNYSGKVCQTDEVGLIQYLAVFLRMCLRVSFFMRETTYRKDLKKYINDFVYRSLMKRNFEVDSTGICFARCPIRNICDAVFGYVSLLRKRKNQTSPLTVARTL